MGDQGSVPGARRSPGEGNSYPCQYSCLENSMHRGAWWVTVHRVARVGHDLATKPPNHHKQTTEKLLFLYPKWGKEKLVISSFQNMGLHFSFYKVFLKDWKCLEENTSNKFLAISLGNEFFRFDTKSKGNRSNNKQLGLHQTNVQPRKPLTKWKGNLPNGRKYLHIIYQIKG